MFILQNKQQNQTTAIDHKHGVQNLRKQCRSWLSEIVSESEAVSEEIDAIPMRFVRSAMLAPTSRTSVRGSGTANRCWQQFHLVQCVY
jgi:hypothetical protein